MSPFGRPMSPFGRPLSPLQILKILIGFAKKCFFLQLLK